MRGGRLLRKEGGTHRTLRRKGHLLRREGGTFCHCLRWREAMRLYKGTQQGNDFFLLLHKLSYCKKK